MEPTRDFEVTVLPNGDLRPSGRTFRARAGEVVTVRELTPEDIRSARQLRYWFAAVVKFYRAAWLKERGVDYGKMGTHAALMCAFGGGPIETPIGKAYPPSSFKTKSEFTRIVDDAREYARDKYKAHIPTPEEWNGEEAA